MIRDKIKSLASDTLTYGVFQTLGRFLSFMLTPLYSNYLTKADNGIVAYLFAIIAIVVYIYSFGMEAAFFRFFYETQQFAGGKPGPAVKRSVDEIRLILNAQGTCFPQA